MVSLGGGIRGKCLQNVGLDTRGWGVGVGGQCNIGRIVRISC